jgi:hypothetical protein
VIRTAREPDAHLGVGIGIASAKTLDRSFVVEGLDHAIDKGAELERHDAHVHPEFFQVGLDQRGHCRPLRAGRTRDDGELDALALLVHERTIRAP